MLLLVLSDSHNNRTALREALDIGRRRGARDALHCGDLGGEAMLALFQGWSLSLALGNTDRDSASLRTALTALGNGSRAAREIHLDADGLRIVALHGDHPDRVAEYIRLGALDFVFHGHTHRRRDDRFGGTRVINPGALGGSAVERRSFCLLDTVAREVEFVELEDTCLSPE